MRQATLCGIALALWERNIPTWQRRCLARWLEKDWFLKLLCIWVILFVKIKTEHICDGSVVFTLGQDNFWLVVQDAVLSTRCSSFHKMQFFPQLFRVILIVMDDVSIEVNLCFAGDSVTFTDLPSQL